MTHAPAHRRAGRFLGVTLLAFGLSTFLFYDAGQVRAGAPALVTASTIR